MPLCPNCNQWYEVSRAGGGCPHCAAGDSAVSSPVGDSRDALVPLARFRNWAEAGFFEDLLHSHGIAAQLEPQEQFDAVGGHWCHQLLLRVPSADFESARRFMERELDETADEPSALSREIDEVYSADGNDALAGAAHRDGRGEVGPPLWKPLAVVLVAGGLAYLGTYGLGWVRPGGAAALHGRPAAHGSDLWRYLTRDGGVWHRELGPRSTGARMWHDPDRGVIHVEEDRDGDGLFERHLQFDPAGRLEESSVAPVPAAPDG